MKYFDQIAKHLEQVSLIDHLSKTISVFHVDCSSHEVYHPKAHTIKHTKSNITEYAGYPKVSSCKIVYQRNDL